MNQREANNDRKYGVSFSQTRNKLKKFVSEYQSVKLTETTAMG